MEITFIIYLSLIIFLKLLYGLLPIAHSFTFIHLTLINKFILPFHTYMGFSRQEYWSNLPFPCFWTVVLKKILESTLDCEEIQPVHPKGDQSWVFIVRTDVEAETPMPLPPDAKSWLIWKDTDPGKDWGQEEKGTTGDEMVGWHHGLNAHGFGWNLGVEDGQGALACCSPWGHKELDMTEQLNWTECSLKKTWYSMECSSWFFDFLSSHCVLFPFCMKNT